ncbi:MAG: preQ(1) synthase [Opitutales bacterium]
MEIETFPNPAPEHDYIIQHIAEEFTSVCPKTGHPDFGKVVVTYVADKRCVELKAFKLYLQGFRNEGIYYEGVLNRIFREMWELLEPRWLRVEMLWNPHGGIRSNLTHEQRRNGYTPPATPLFGFSR